MAETIKIATEHNKLILVKSATVNTKIINGIQVQLECRTSDWDALTKTIAFFRGDDSYGVTLAAGETTCNVPWEILNTDDECNYEISVFGVGNNVRLSTNRIAQYINLGAYSEVDVSQSPTETLTRAVAAAMSQLESLTPAEIEDEMLSLLDKVATIKLAVSHGQLILVRNYETPAKNINAVRVSIEFRSDEWATLTKTITFFKGQRSYGVILPAGKTSCFIPWEILDYSSGGEYKIGIFGINNNMRLTTNKLKLMMIEGSYATTINSQPPTPSAYEQLLAAINDADYASSSDISACLAEAKAYADTIANNLSINVDKHYVHRQSIPASTWTICHNLNKWPSVNVVDSANNVVIGDIKYVDQNTLTVTFSGIFSGKAYLN